MSSISVRLFREKQQQKKNLSSSLNGSIGSSGGTQGRPCSTMGSVDVYGRWNFIDGGSAGTRSIPPNEPSTDVVEEFAVVVFFFAVGQDRPGTRARDAFQNCRPVALVLHVYSLSLSLSFTKRPTLMEHGTRRTDKDVASVFHTHTHTHTHTHHISFFLLAHFLQSGSIWWLQNVPVPHNVPPKPRWGRGQHRGTSTRLKKLKQKPPQEDRRRPSIKTKINESEPKNVPPSSTEPPGGGRGHGRRGRGQLKTTTKPTAAFKKKTNKVMNINRKKT